MYIENKAKDKNGKPKSIFLRSFEGCVFEIPYGCSWIYDPAGKYLVEEIFRVVHTTKTDKYGYDNGYGVPDISESNRAQWIKGGKKLTQVERFTVRAHLLPRTALIKIALREGIDKDRVTEFHIDANIDKEVIAEEINNLPVSEDKKYPKD